MSRVVRAGSTVRKIGLQTKMEGGQKGGWEPSEDVGGAGMRPELQELP